jgi:hypothetical protein
MNPITYRESYVKNILSIKVTILCSWENGNLVIIMFVEVLQELYNHRNHSVLSTSMVLINSKYLYTIVSHYVTLHEELCCVVYNSSL